MSERRFALFVDGDNISHRLLPPIVKELNRQGEIVIRRVYGDWTDDLMRGWKQRLHSYPLRPVQQFRYGDNATDGALIMDAVELVSRSERAFDAACIASSDGDFYSLALRLREHGVFVVGIGRQKTPQVFVRSCDHFIFLENLEDGSQEREQPLTTTNGGRTADTPSKDLLSEEPVEDLIRRAYGSGDPESDGWLRLSDLGKLLRKDSPGFDPRSYNHNSLLSLVEAYPDVFEVLKDDLRPPNYWVRPYDTANVLEKEGRIKRFIGHYGFIAADDGDYFFTISNLASDDRNKRLEKDVRVAFSVFKAPDPSGESTSDKNGRAKHVRLL